MAGEFPQLRLIDRELHAAGSAGAALPPGDERHGHPRDLSSIPDRHAGPPCRRDTVVVSIGVILQKWGGNWRRGQ
jgi:hypothetical protein